MKFVVVGAGAVGAVVGTLLAADGHDVQFWVRPAQRTQLGRLSIERVGGHALQIDAPRCLSRGERVPAVDWVIVCVRGEQLDPTLAELAAALSAGQRIAIAAVSLHGVTEQVQRAGLSGRAYALHASFGSFADPERPLHFHWYPFSLPSTVTPDGERERGAEARALARCLARAGLPARSARSFTAAMRFMVAMNSVLALGWDLCGWDLPRLAADRALRRETALAMHEAVPLVVRARSLLRLLPAFVFDLCLRLLPHLMGKRAREVWRHHGPKIRGQTDYVVRELLAEPRKGAHARATPTLARLFERWRAATGK